MKCLSNSKNTKYTATYSYQKEKLTIIRNDCCAYNACNENLLYFHIVNFDVNNNHAQIYEVRSQLPRKSCHR